jgi:hypothetical protein
MGSGFQVMTIILQEDAKRAILADFSIWSAENLGGRPATDAEGLKFFGHLKLDRQQLLQFRHPNLDKWEVVRSWLTGAGLVSK